MEEILAQGRLVQVEGAAAESRLASSKLVQLARPCQVPPDRQGAGVSLGESQYGAGTLADGLLQASAGVPLGSRKPSWFVAGGGNWSNGEFSSYHQSQTADDTSDDAVGGVVVMAGRGRARRQVGEWVNAARLGNN